MNRTLTLTLAVAAGLLGGLLTRYLPPVHAKAEIPHVDVRLQAFTLIDAEGHVSPVVLVDQPGRLIWTNSKSLAESSK
jgi:hypothetical protein